MGLWEISFRAQYDYPFINITREHPGVSLSMWCLWNRELVQVPTSDPDVLKSVEKEIGRAGHVVERWTEGDDARLLLLKCSCETLDSPWNVWEAHGCFDAPPAVFQDGWGYFRVISLEEGVMRGLFDDLRGRGPTELLKKREIALSTLPTSVWVNSLFSDLTTKQVDALLKAGRYGYYESPRKVSTQSIAQGVGVSRSTYEEHLRKAENRVMAALMPYLQLYTASAPPPEMRLTRRTAVEIA